MKYYINIQYRPKHRERPEDEPMMVDIRSENGDFTPIPNMGDHVVFTRPIGNGNKSQQIEGVVENRLFTYLVQDICTVNIVVTDSDTDFGILIKE